MDRTQKKGRNSEEIFWTRRTNTNTKGLLTKGHLGEHFDLPFSNDSLLFGAL